MTIAARSTTVIHPAGSTPSHAGGTPQGLPGVPQGAISTSPYSAVIHHPAPDAAGPPPALTSGGSVPLVQPGAPVLVSVPSGVPGAPGSHASEALALLTRAAELLALPPPPAPPPTPRRRDVDQWLAALEHRVSVLEARDRAPRVAELEAPPETERPGAA